MADIDLSNYVEVNERIEAFYEKYPDGSLQSDWQLCQFGDDTVLVVEARAFRTPDDKRPGIGQASEPYPGKTPYTKDSELSNGETSAWGRALAALGFKVDRGIASASEVRNHQGSSGKKPPSEGQLKFLADLLYGLGVLDKDVQSIKKYAEIELTGGKDGTISEAISGLQEDKTKAEIAERLEAAAKKWEAKSKKDEK